MEYTPRQIEQKWQEYWAKQQIFAAANPGETNASKPKYYVLDMFPYPSGAGLHVGHPLGYIASDVIARYKRHQGYNVLHPMGYDSFGLPAEQYAIQTGRHPEETTQENILRYRNQLDRIGFSYDWSREVRTSNPEYYRWTQWIFLQLYHSWYNPVSNKAEPVETLIEQFETNGFDGHLHEVLTGGVEKDLESFTAEKWKKFDEVTRQLILMHFRLAYLSEAYVNWCPALGTVLANDEVKDGLSERGGHPVERKLMKQWSLRITAYANRLLEDLNDLAWPDSLKDAQRNWIGKSAGCSIRFQLENSSIEIEVFTTRPDTLFGVSFITVAPESDLVINVVSDTQRKTVEEYITYATNRSERERQSDVKKCTGVFSGSYVIHPFTQEKIPVWIGEYVLAGYGTGAVMGVPAHDSRDHAFARHFSLPIKQVIEAPANIYIENEAYEEKNGTLIHSDFLNGLSVKDAIERCIEEVGKKGIGKKRINYRLRDAVFGRQRYWGEPIPIFYKNDIPYPLKEEELPLILPEVDAYLPTETGEPPLARASHWKYQGKYEYEHTTMPGWAGSSWYFLRYMDAQNKQAFASAEAMQYWREVDLYIGGAEHATGHLLYFRFWTKFLFDRGFVCIKEPVKKLINQGMIQGVSAIIHRVQNANTIVSAGQKDNYQTTPIHIDISLTDGNKVDIEALKKWRDDFADAEFITENENLFCSNEVEKMSKRWHNVVNPDTICEAYGADTLRLYEMFLGPLEDHKPWSTSSIEGVYRFLRKLWRLFYDASGHLLLQDKEPTKEELKALHKCIKKVRDDLDRYSFNTVVSSYMICVNELTDLKCTNKHVLEQFLVLLSPYAPHIAEELWEASGNKPSIAYQPFPVFNEECVEEDCFAYPVQVNGKMRFTIPLSLQLGTAEITQEVLSSDQAQKYLEGKTPKKVIVVPGKIVNVVV